MNNAYFVRLAGHRAAAFAAPSKVSGYVDLPDLAVEVIEKDIGHLQGNKEMIAEYCSAVRLYFRDYERKMPGKVERALRRYGK